MDRNQNIPDHRDSKATAGLTMRLERRAKDRAAELARLPIDERKGK